MNEADARRHEIIGRQAVRIDQLEEYHKNMVLKVERLLGLFAKIAGMEGREGIDDHEFTRVCLEEILPAITDER